MSRAIAVADLDRILPEPILPAGNRQPEIAHDRAHQEVILQTPLLFKHL